MDIKDKKMDSLRVNDLVSELIREVGVDSTKSTIPEAEAVAPHSKDSVIVGGTKGKTDIKQMAVNRLWRAEIGKSSKQIEEPKDLAFKYIKLADKINSAETGAELYADLIKTGIFDLIG